MKTTTKNEFADLPQLALGQCPVCGTRESLVHFQGEAFPVQVGDLTDSVDGLSGDRCRACEEVFFDADSAQRYADAGDALVIQYRKAEGDKLKKARLALGLSQADAGILAGGGHNGFSRYENGSAVPVPAVWNLFQLLEKHPQLASDIPGVTVKVITGKSSARKPRVGVLIKGGKRVVLQVKEVARPKLVAKAKVKAKPAIDVGRLVVAKSAQSRMGAKPAAKVAAKKAAPRRSA
jgi:HTH-type transcriptional regulator/antitoxin MqsA